jgi:hypothetical protein
MRCRTHEEAVHGLTRKIPVKVMYEIIREPVIISTFYGNMNVQIFPRLRVVPEGMFDIRGDDDGLSWLETALFSVDFVAEDTGEDVEGLGLVVVVVVRWCRGRLRSLTLSDR